jgi:hypothetical protein
MRAEAKPRRRTWPWIVIAILAISGVIIGVSIANGTWGNGAASTATPTSSPAATESPDLGDPSGCLGGPERNSAMLLTASDDAPFDKVGAVDFAAAFVRWVQRYPYPSADEAAEVQRAALASESFTSDLAQYLADKPDLSGGIVAPGENYYMNTVPGVWYVESFEGESAVVSIGSGFVIDGALSSNLRSSITVSLTWDGERWRVTDADGMRTPAELYQIGTNFKEGC